MENYNIIKKEVNDRLLFKLSQVGYALNCDLLFTNRISEIEQNIQLANNLKNGDKVFISLLNNELTINLNELVCILSKNNVKVYFYLMYEPIVSMNIINLLLPVAVKLYINNNVYEIIIIPPDHAHNSGLPITNNLIVSIAAFFKAPIKILKLAKKS